MRAVVSNVFADDNRGGAAITIETIRVVREALPDAAVTLVAVQSDAGAARDALRHTLAAVPDAEVVGAAVPVGRGRFAGGRAVLRSVGALALPRRAARHSPALARIADAAVVVSKGGYVFVERSSGRDLMSLWLTGFPLVFARRVGVPTVVLGATIGPLTTRRSRWLVGLLVRSASLVVPRDRQSAATARDVGVRADRLVTVPDIVFRRHRPTPDASAARAAALGVDVPFAAVSVRGAGARTAHVEHLAAVVGRLAADGLVRRVAVVNQVHGTVTSDAAAGQALADRLDGLDVTVVSDDLDPEALIELYGAADLLLGQRMHASIFALVAGTPAFGVVSDEPGKLLGVLEMVGLEDLLAGHAGEAPEAVAERIRAVLADGDVRARVRDALAGAGTAWEQVVPRVRAIARPG
jgi:polysaccharide pyruvyl transferase WcaK-like protein